MHIKIECERARVRSEGMYAAIFLEDLILSSINIPSYDCLHSVLIIDPGLKTTHFIERLLNFICGIRCDKILYIRKINSFDGWSQRNWDDKVKLSVYWICLRHSSCIELSRCFGLLLLLGSVISFHSINHDLNWWHWHSTITI